MTSIGEYIHNKRIKVDQQLKDKILFPPPLPSSSPSSPSSSSSIPSDTSSLFHSCLFWFNGYFSPPSPSSNELESLVYAHGGRVTYVLLPSTTHIITQSLQEGKIKELKETRQRIPQFYVYPSYIIDCIEKGELLSPLPYILEGLKESNLNKYFNKSPKKQLPSLIPLIASSYSFLFPLRSMGNRY